MAVDGLFGGMSHRFRLDDATDRAILIGPNGVGKTKLLTLVNALLNLEVSTLLSEPYASIRIGFRNGDEVGCTRLETRKGLAIQLDLRHGSGSISWIFSLETRNEFEANADLHRLLEPEDPLPFRPRRRGGSRQWAFGGQSYNIDQLISLSLSEDSLSDLSSMFGEEAREIKEYLGDYGSLMVKADRLASVTKAEHAERMFFEEEDRTEDDTIAPYIRREFELARLEYLKVSQELDSSFPARLLQNSKGGGSRIFKTEEQLRTDYERLRKIFSETTGTVRVDELEMAPLPERPLETWEIKVLNLHANDGLEKIRALTDLSRRIKVFETLVNAKLVRSRIVVNPNGLFLKFNNGQIEVPQVSNLSSGERHQIQMAFSLVFKSKEKSIVLVDEPELSLHVNWQNQILNEFEELRRLNRFQYIVATHSPEIIGDAWAAVRPLTLN